jgi:glycosyltransferase involved in cell wall biosynthesis
MKFVVVMSTHNSASLVRRALSSIDDTLSGYSWVLVTADDGSADNTHEVVSTFPTSATLSVHRKFTKATTLSEAKNRALALLAEVPVEFDLVLFVDDDDEMLPARVELARRLTTEGQDVAFGDLEVVGLNGSATVACGGRRLMHRRFSPCASVIRRRWVSAQFWQEVPGVLEDSYSFQLLRREHDLAFCYHRVGPVHRYWRRQDSYSYRKSGVMKATTERAIASSRCYPSFSVQPGNGADLAESVLELWGLKTDAGSFELPASAVVLVPLDVAKVKNSHPGRSNAGWSDELVLAGGLWRCGWPVEWLKVSAKLCQVLDQFDYLSVDERRKFNLVSKLVCSTYHHAKA